MVDLLKAPRRIGYRAAALMALLALAACGATPQPYWGYSGRQAARLAVPPAYRIAVPAPTEALLTDVASSDWAVKVADALEAAEIPAVAGPPAPLDWRLTLRADRDGERVIPRYALSDADGKPLGSAAGAPVALAEWGEADEALFKTVAARDATVVSGLLNRVEAVRKATNATALAGVGPPKLRFTQMTGAPGDGNGVLLDRMRHFLAGNGLMVQDQADGAGFGLVGQVHMVPVPNKLERVEIQWIVTRRDGIELGRVLQMNEVPAGLLDRHWGDVAYVVAEEAAGGVRDVIRNAGGFGPVDVPKPLTESRPPDPAAVAGSGAVPGALAVPPAVR